MKHEDDSEMSHHQQKTRTLSIPCPKDQHSQPSIQQLDEDIGGDNIQQSDILIKPDHRIPKTKKIDVQEIKPHRIATEDTAATGMNVTDVIISDNSEDMAATSPDNSAAYCHSLGGTHYYPAHPYECYICELKFISRNCLDNHMKLIHEEEIYNCTLCHNSFSGCSAFKTHNCVPPRAKDKEMYKHMFIFKTYANKNNHLQPDIITKKKIKNATTSSQEDKCNEHSCEKKSPVLKYKESNCNKTSHAELSSTRSKPEHNIKLSTTRNKPEHNTKPSSIGSKPEHNIKSSSIRSKSDQHSIKPSSTGSKSDQHIKPSSIGSKSDQHIKPSSIGSKSEHSIKPSSIVSKADQSNTKPNLTGSKVYQCNVCRQRFTDAMGLVSHLKTHTHVKHSSSQKDPSLSRPSFGMLKLKDNLLYRCSMCDKTFMNKASITKHMELHQYMCTTCDYNFDLKHEFIKHMTAHKGGWCFDDHKKTSASVVAHVSKRSSIPTDVSKYYDSVPAHMSKQYDSAPAPVSKHDSAPAHLSKHDSAAHVSKHDSAPVHVSKHDSVPVHVSKHDSASAHVSKHDSASAHVSKPDSASADVSKHDSAPAHVSKHDSAPALVSKNCDAVPPDISNLEHCDAAPLTYTEVFNEANQMQYQCDQCKLTFPSTLKVSQHFEIHKTRIYTCHICNKKLGSASVLKQHVKVHTENTCDKCSLTFHKHANLIDHYIKTHNESWCAICHKKSCICWALHRVRTRDGLLTLFICNICSATFKHKHDVNIHLKTHISGIQPHMCHICNSHKTTHILTQEDMDSSFNTHMSYKCHICRREFTYKINFDTHIQKHMRETILSKPQNDMIIIQPEQDIVIDIKDTKSDQDLDTAMGHDKKSENDLDMTLDHDIKPEHDLDMTMDHDIKPEYYLDTAVDHDIKPEYYLDAAVDHDIKPDHELYTAMDHDIKADHELDTAMDRDIKAYHELDTAMDHDIKPDHELYTGMDYDIKPDPEVDIAMDYNIKPNHGLDTAAVHKIKQEYGLDTA